MSASTTVSRPARPARPRLRLRLGVSFARLSIVAWTSLYFGLLAYIYAEEFERWAYLGFWYAGTDALRLGICYALCIIPGLVLRLQVRPYSTFIHWLIYYFIYIPAVLIPVLQGLRDDVLLLALALFVSFGTIILFPRIPPLRSVPKVSKRTFWLAFSASYVLLFSYALFIFRNDLSLPGFEDVYSQRSIASDVATGTLVGYATGILSGCLNPFLLAVGLVYRRKVLFALGLVGQVFVYSTFALKSVLASILVLLVFYRFLLRTPTIRIGKLPVLICASIVLPLLFVRLTDLDESPLINNLVTLVFMRTYGMVGALTGIYHDFFTDHPVTLFSHINIVGQIIPYPYPLSIGEVIGESLGFDMNSNANFFATDGIASLGTAGIVVMGFVAGFCLRAIDRFVPPANLRLLCIASTPVAMSLANTSLFTTLLTGGLLALILLCHVWTDDGAHPAASA
jgi:hypothetical protein